MAAKKQRVIIIVGPTSSGKSALAVELARIVGGEVVSADARQVYRGLDIGTGKITARQAHGVRHHLLNVANPRDVFTAHDFVQQGRAVIAGIIQRGNLPIICGGSGFYIDALVGRFRLPDAGVDPALRKKLEKKSAVQLLLLLEKRDPRRAKTIDPHNKRRLIRALEIAEQLGSNPSSRRQALYDVLWMGLRPTQETLRTSINARLHERLRDGMIAEARRLHAQGLSYRRMESLGLEYRSLARFLRKKITRLELEIELQHAIWRYAKRQLTYWRRNSDIHWFDPRHDSRAQQLAIRFLTR